MEYKIEFKVWQFDIDNFKEKQAYSIMNMIQYGRLMKWMKFSCFGLITFDKDDEKHKFPIISELDKFNRLKTNCIIFDLNYNTYNNGKYDKCFIYHSLGHQISNYGFIMYNSKTGAISQRYFIDYTYDELLHSLTRTFHSMLKDELWINYFGKKYDATHNKNGLSIMTCPTIADYYKCKENLEKRYNIYNDD